MTLLRNVAAAAAVVLASQLAGCWDSSPAETVPLPPVGTSRIAAVERLDHAGSVQEVTRYAYDARGWLVGTGRFQVVDGVESARPSATVTREHDEHGRVLRITTRQGDTGTLLEASYGLNGRLERTTTTAADGRQTVTSFTWDGDRMSSYTVEGPQPQTTRLVYDGQGRPAKLVHGDPARRDESRFEWRADGQLGNVLLSPPSAPPLSYARSFSAAGQLTDLRLFEDGFWLEWNRFEYDTRGRVAFMLDGVADELAFDPDEFVVVARYRVVWEDALCQPVYEPAAPPSVDFGLTGTASAVGATLVCSDRP